VSIYSCWLHPYLGQPEHHGKPEGKVLVKILPDVLIKIIDLVAAPRTRQVCPHTFPSLLAHAPATPYQPRNIHNIDRLIIPLSKLTHMLRTLRRNSVRVFAARLKVLAVLIRDKVIRVRPVRVDSEFETFFVGVVDSGGA